MERTSFYYYCRVTSGTRIADCVAGRIVKLLQASRNLSRTVLQRREFLRRRGQSSSTLANGRSPLGSSRSLVSNTRSSHGKLSAMILSYTPIFYLSSTALLYLLTRRLFLTVCAESCRNGKPPFAPVCLVSTTDHRPPTTDQLTPIHHNAYWKFIQIHALAYLIVHLRLKNVQVNFFTFAQTINSLKKLFYTVFRIVTFFHIRHNLKMLFSRNFSLGKFVNEFNVFFSFHLL